MSTFKHPIVLGAGSWGTALAMVLAAKGPVKLWGYLQEHVEELQKSRVNTPYLPDLRLRDEITVTHDLKDARDADLIVFVTPSRAIRETCQKLASLRLPEGAVLVSCTKGIEADSGKCMTEVLSEYFPKNPVAVLSGPSHAEEVARGTPSAVVIGCENVEVGKKLQESFATDGFRVYTEEDVKGIELGGAIKNVFAIAAGVCDGLGLGDNTKAALVTRALAEEVRLGVVLGGEPETFQGLSGIGDLIVTCFSRHSRNRGVGERIGRGESLEDITHSMKMIAEGVPNTLSLYQCAKKCDVYTPLLDEVYAMLYQNKPPITAMQDLMARDLKPERNILEE